MTAEVLTRDACMLRMHFRVMHSQPDSRLAYDAARRRRRYREPTPAELVPLRLLGEQFAIPVDQMARFLECDLEETKRVLAELEAAALVESSSFTVDEPLWYWLAHRGAKRVGLGVQSRYPGPTRLPRRRAVNEVRLHLAERVPQGRWIARRLLDRRPAPRERRANSTPRVPDGVFEYADERHAIQVLLTHLPLDRLLEAIEGFSARFDAVVYFCTPRTRSALERLKAEHSLSRLSIQLLPEGALRDSESSSIKRVTRHPAPPELAIIDVLAQQRAVAIDQLARFFDYSLAETKEIILRMVEAGYVNCRVIVPDQPAWVWLLKAAAPLSTTGLHWAGPPPLGRLPLTRMVNEVRLYVNQVAPQGRWESRRELAKGRGPNPPIPNAVLHIDGERHAINVFLTLRVRADLIRMITKDHTIYDAVVCFCSPQNRRILVKLAQSHNWPKLAVLDLPGN